LRAVEKGLALTCALPPQPLIVSSDEEKIERILWVLLENAIKFTLSGSVSVRAVHTAQAAQLEVRDTGIGMAPEERLTALQGLAQGDSSPRRRFRGLGWAYESPRGCCSYSAAACRRRARPSMARASW
jgi:signal transduction histidine kinase